MAYTVRDATIRDRDRKNGQPKGGFVVTPPPPSGPSWFADENNAFQAAGALNAALGNPGPPGGEMPPTSKDAKAGRVP